MPEEGGGEKKVEDEEKVAGRNEEKAQIIKAKNEDSGGFILAKNWTDPKTLIDDKYLAFSLKMRHEEQFFSNYFFDKRYLDQNLWPECVCSCKEA